MSFNYNKYKYKARFQYMKQQGYQYYLKVKAIAKQVFIPLAVFQLVRTILFPTPFDVLLVLIIFAIIFFLLLDWL